MLGYWSKYMLSAWICYDNWLVLTLTQNERPSVQDVPKALVPFLESCWAEDPKCRPEFMEITDFLHSFCSTLTKAVEIEDRKSNKKVESASTGHLRKKYEEKGNKRKSLLPSLFPCFEDCFSDWLNGMMNPVLGFCKVWGTQLRVGMDVHGWLYLSPLYCTPSKPDGFSTELPFWFEHCTELRIQREKGNQWKREVIWRFWSNQC